MKNTFINSVLALALAATVGACSPDRAADMALATRCMRAADDNRALLSSTWLSSADIEIEGGRVTVRTEVPVGISIGGRLRYRYWVYRCRVRGEGMEFLGYEARREPPPERVTPPSG